MLRPDFPPLPDRMKRLPVDGRGFPVPWFVAWFDGKPDFRVVRPEGFADAIGRDLCWICGQPLGRNKDFVIGPLCALQRLTAEPPSHHDCSLFAVKVCPFITHPMARRGSRPLPAETVKFPEGHVHGNPGLYCIWTTRSFSIVGGGRVPLLKLGDPVGVSWWVEKREATRAEIEAAYEAQVPKLAAIPQYRAEGTVERDLASLRALWPKAGDNL